MNVAPRLTVTRIAQLQPGDLFVLPYGDAGCIAMKVRDPDGDELIVPLGPVLPDGLPHPSLITAPAATVISFGKDFTLRLPSRPGAWRLAEPTPDIHCLVVTEQGVYVRANFVPGQGKYQPCYIDMAAGAVVTDGRGAFQSYVPPPGHKGFAIEWEILTAEAEPRLIFTYPCRPTARTAA